MFVTHSPAASVVIQVSTQTGGYPVLLGPGLLGAVGAHLNELCSGTLSSGKRRVIVISSPAILEPWGEPLLSGFAQPPLVLAVPGGEAHKRLSTVESLAEQLAEAGADRDSVLIAFGGGVLGDMVGFVAAAYMRGISYVQVPTTLLAQVDSSVGGKTGVNLLAGKNLFGAFHHPLAVYADIETLSTLPASELRAGLQEAIKAGIIRDRALFEYLENNADRVLCGDFEALLRVVSDSIRVKADVVAADERESGLRMILNLGHTLGHAIEAATGYGQLLHGEAIAWGMLAATRLAVARGLVSAGEQRRMEDTIRRYGPLKPFCATSEELVARTAKDKKNRSGTRSFVLPVGIGDAAVVRDMRADELTAAATSIVSEAEALLRTESARGPARR